MTEPTVAVIAGGVGAARLLRGAVLAHPGRVVAVVNTGDDTILHGLHIAPDLDTITYTLAGEHNDELGWGLRGETWQAMDMVERYGGISWFRLGDRDLGTHLFRTHRLAAGATLSQVTAEIAAAWTLPVDLVPVTDDRLETRVTLAEDGTEIGFQEYFVQRRHQVAVSGVRFVGADAARPSPGAEHALRESTSIVIAPSNPIVSVGPVRAVAGVEDLLRTRRDRVVAISPIVGGTALKGPADRLLRELGHEASVVGVARLYREVASVLVVDEADRALADAVEAEGLRCVVTDTIMHTAEVARALTETAITALEDPAT